MAEFDYPEPVSKLLTLGDTALQAEWLDYQALGITADHIPELIRMVQDEALHWAGPDRAEVWAPAHAWRALALLHAREAVKPLVELFDYIDEHDDDWVAEDLPKALGILGPAALPELHDCLIDSSRGLWARVAASNSLVEIGRQCPESRMECIAILAKQLERFSETDPTLNALIINDLVKLKALVATPVIHDAFVAERVDLSVVGDWEEVEICLGLIQERQTPRPRFNFPDLSGPLLRPREEKRDTPRPDRDLGRNDPCWCGSGKKYKHCHLLADRRK